MPSARFPGIAICGLGMLATPFPASAQQLLFHFPLDGSAGVAGSAAGDSRLYVLDGGSPPTTAPGKFGSALYFNGTTVIAMPFKLDAATYPNVTVTAWVKVDAESTGERTVFSAGNGNVPKLMVYGDRANFTAARGSLMFNTGMPRDEWVFVAGVVDIANARLHTYQGDGQLLKEGANVSNLYPPSSYRNPDDPSLPAMPYVFVGSHGFNQWRANRMAIDDVRVYAGALTADQIEGIRSATGAQVAASPAGTTTSSADGSLVGTGGDTGGDYVTDPDLVGTGGATGGDYDSGDTRPAFQGGVFTQENVDALSEARAEHAAPVITYASEEEALAAQERREREAAEAEFARQQNELEAARRASESASGSTTTTGPIETGTPYPVGEMRFSGVAGLVGQNKRTLDLGDQFMHWIGWWEESDSPCLIAIAGESEESEIQLNVGCRNNIRMFGLFRTRDSTIKKVHLPNSVIGSIAVCNNKPPSLFNANEASRLKGVRVSGDRINEDGTTTYVPASDEASLSSCAEWSLMNLCPVNPVHLATGIIVHSNDSGTSRKFEDIVGLQLICRQIGLR